MHLADGIPNSFLFPVTFFHFHSSLSSSAVHEFYVCYVQLVYYICLKKNLMTAHGMIRSIFFKNSFLLVLAAPNSSFISASVICLSIFLLCYFLRYIATVRCCLKNSFGVSRYAAKKRIIELGWTEVRGVYTYCTTEYVDDHEIESSLPADHTYTLPLRCIAQIFRESKEFATLVSSKRYIYIDGHMCRNDEKYVIKEYGIAFGLTEYAKHHMSECCISFKQIYSKQEYSYTYGELNEEDLTVIVEHSLDIEQKKKLRQAMSERNNEEQKLIEKTTSNPLGDAVKFHMKRCGVTSDILADRSGLGIATIAKLRNGKKVKLETILAFSVSL